MSVIEMSYGGLISNIIKRLLMLAGKLAGYKGFAVLVATVLLCKGNIGEAAWASVIISALCGAVVPKTISILGGKQNEKDFDWSDGRAAGAAIEPSPSCRKTISRGQQRIRAAVESARRRADSAAGDNS